MKMKSRIAKLNSSGAKPPDFRAQREWDFHVACVSEVVHINYGGALRLSIEFDEGEWLLGMEDKLSSDLIEILSGDQEDAPGPGRFSRYPVVDIKRWARFPLGSTVEDLIEGANRLNDMIVSDRKKMLVGFVEVGS